MLSHKNKKCRNIGNNPFKAVGTIQSIIVKPFFIAASMSVALAGCVSDPLPTDTSSSAPVIQSSSVTMQTSSSLAAISSSSAITAVSSVMSSVASSVAISSVAASSSKPMAISSSSAVTSSSSSMPAIPTGSTLVYAVNAGGPALSIGGIDYKADNFSTGGTELTTTDAIAGTTNDALYQSFRWGKYKYEVPVTNSTYSVALNFAEMYHTAAAGRYFSVTVEGQPVFTDKDLFAEVGAKTAYNINVPNVMVVDGKLTIELTASIDNATISAFAIYSNAGGKFVEPPKPIGCNLPTSFKWESSGPLIGPKAGTNWYSAKDPSVVFYEGKYHIFATYAQPGNNTWRSFHTSFTDWANANNDANKFDFIASPMGAAVAPQVFYYRPQNRWYQVTQWGPTFSTTTDIENPSSWSSKKTLLKNGPEGNILDFWNICDDQNCHLFFSRDDGVLYKAKTSRANFPNFTYDTNTGIVMREPVAGALFEAANVYKVDGQDLYLLLVEAIQGGNERYFRSWTAKSLDGPWQKLADTYANPFAGARNVEYPGGNWVAPGGGISHGELVRSGYDEYMTIDPCNLQYVYQGIDRNARKPDNSGYAGDQYRLGLLKFKK